MHLHPHRPADPNAIPALVAGPLILVGLAALAVAIHDAPVVHAAHAVVTSR